MKTGIHPALLILCSACVASEVVDVRDGDVLLSAIVNADGHPVRLQLGGGPISRGPEDYRLVTFVLPSGTVQDPSGQPIDPEALVLRVDSPCGCPVPAVDGPLVLTRGAACPPPRFARALVEGADVASDDPLVELVRPQMFLQREGPACEAHVRPDDRALLPRPLGAQLPEDAYQPEATALTDDGAIGWFSEAFAIDFSFEGARREWSSVPFVGPVVAATAIPEGYLVASWDRRQLGFTRYDLFDRTTMTHQPLDLQGIMDGQNFRPSSLAFHDRILLPGRMSLADRAGFSQGTIALLGCELQESTLNCEFLMRPRDLDGLVDPGELYGVTRTANDMLVAITSEGTLFAGPFSETPHVRAIELFEDFDCQSETCVAFPEMAVANDRVYVCSHITDVGTQIWEVKVNAAGLFEAKDVFTSGAGFDGNCLGVTTSSTGRQSFWLRSNLVLDTTADSFQLNTRSIAEGVTLQNPGNIKSAHARGFTMVSHAGGRTEVVSSDGVVHRAFGSQTNPTAFTSIVPTEERVIAFELGLDRYWDLGTPEALEPVPQALSGPDLSGVVRAAVSNGNGYVLVGSDGESGFVANLSQDGKVSFLERNLPRLFDITELSPGTFIAVGNQMSVFRIQGSNVELIPTQADDPVTSVVESKPTHEECDPGPLAGSDGEAALLAVDAKDGIAWAVGCGALILRISPFEAVRFSLPDELVDQEADPGEYDPVYFSAVKVLDTWEIIASSEEFRPEHSDQPFSLRIHPKLRERLDGFSVEVLSQTLPGNALRKKGGTPIEILGDRDDLTYVFQTEWIPRSTVDRVSSSNRVVRTSNKATSAAQLPGGRVLVGGVNGHLTLFEPAPD